MAVYALSQAVAAGDQEAEKQIEDYTAAVLADKSIPESDRAAVLLYKGNVVLMKRLGMRLFIEGMSAFQEDFELTFIDSIRETLKQFPGNSQTYTMLVSIAQRSPEPRKKALAEEIMRDSAAPKEVKALASNLLQGTRPYNIGHPLDISFTALDGREVDLAKLKGKVVLIEFWSTSCGPCIAEMPRVKAAYNTYQARGFEIIGIALNDTEVALRRFIKEKQMSWPQHFENKGWEDKFALRYGVFSMPTMWLVDKKGNLRHTDVREDLEQRISALLAEKD